MADIDILIPVLSRPQHVGPLLESITHSTSVSFHVLFICSRGDWPEIAEVRKHGAHYLTFDGPPAKGQYAKKINLGYQATTNPWIFCGADDLDFRPGWDEHALDMGAPFTSTNDRCNSHVRMGLLATHPLIERRYVNEQGCSLDGPGSIYHEGYSHNFVDCETSVLARDRRVFAYASRSLVVHNHPLVRRGKMDEVYEIGLKDFAVDRTLFCERLAAYPRDELVRRFTQAEKQAERTRGERP